MSAIRFSATSLAPQAGLAATPMTTAPVRFAGLKEDTLDIARTFTHPKPAVNQLRVWAARIGQFLYDINFPFAR